MPQSGLHRADRPHKLHSVLSSVCYPQLLEKKLPNTQWSGDNNSQPVAAHAVWIKRSHHFLIIPRSVLTTKYTQWAWRSLGSTQAHMISDRIQMSLETCQTDRQSDTSNITDCSKMWSSVEYVQSILCAPCEDTTHWVLQSSGSDDNNFPQGDVMPQLWPLTD